MGIKPDIGSVVASANQQYSMASLFSVTAAAGDPAFLIVDGLDRN
jgi:hypothetical protein